MTIHITDTPSQAVIDITRYVLSPFDDDSNVDWMMEA